MGLFGVASGCLPFTNACVVVPQDQWLAVEYFGKFRKLLTPGLNFAGCDILGSCITLSSISQRVQEQRIAACSKTKDAVWVNIKVAVVYTVRQENAEAALYRLADVEAQMNMYVGDLLRSSIAALTLQQAFQREDSIAAGVQSRLRTEMQPHGIEILRVLVIEVMPDKVVVDAMNRVKKEYYLRQAAYVRAEAFKSVSVKEAEGLSEAAYLQGAGVAKQRAAILDGLRETVTDDQDMDPDPELLSSMMLLTQSMEMLSEVAGSKKASVVFIPRQGIEDFAERSKQHQAKAPSTMKMGGSQKKAPVKKKTPPDLTQAERGATPATPASSTAAAAAAAAAAASQAEAEQIEAKASEQNEPQAASSSSAAAVAATAAAAADEEDTTNSSKKPRKSRKSTRLVDAQAQQEESSKPDSAEVAEKKRRKSRKSKSAKADLKGHDASDEP